MKRPGSDADPRPDLVGLSPDEVAIALREHFDARGVPGYRVRQVLAWLHERDAPDFATMTDLPVAEREALGRAFRLSSPRAATTSRSTDGTVKHLWQFDDGETIESVLIPSGSRLTLCMSSQAGCAMACVFCATGWSGYRRQLTTGEIIAQFRAARRWSANEGAGAITNVVFMGMGEPLANREAVMPALSLLNGALGLGARRVTVSTVGIVPGILELAARPEQFRLAVSLHAPNPEIRRRLVPIEKKYPLPELMEALRAFDAAGGRRITFEYVLLDRVNDEAEHARELADLIREFGAHVNLIPYNPIPGASWRPSSRDRQRLFLRILRERGIEATIREPRGRDIAAACGQLRADHEMHPPKPYLTLLQPERQPR
jgi:23S rRNA (adenine2503-C2)-methyltransferase